ncbi:oxidoreductase [Paenibacillus sp. N3.4]|uniref:oxidoreductase n=1 Tax=Paenibacillus sp. N3.4 TaxID=2603222 RepID=UPI0011C88116|nr:oxidoreductase [Paenibacillus sp. N3.4]TXK80998.1 oxidoreductase [Paenibacillus sp. N3.4]
MGKTAIVAGGTGLVGHELIQLLLQDRIYEKVIAIVRTNIPTAGLVGHEKLVQWTTDYRHLESVIDPSVVEHSHVFCTLGTTIKKAGTQEQFRKVDFEYPMELGEIALKYGADAFVIVTAMGANRQSSIFYNKVKGEVEEGLRGLGLPSLSILRPSLILGDRREVRIGERMGSAVSRFLAPLMIGGLRTYRPIHARTIANGLIKAAQSGVTGVRVLTSAEIAKLSSP